MIRTKCEVLSNRRTGVYRSLTFVAPDIAEVARPGQFVQVGVPEDRTFMLRRPFSIHQASRRLVSPNRRTVSRTGAVNVDMRLSLE